MTADAQHATFDPADSEDQANATEPDHAGFEDADTAPTPPGEDSIVDEWAGDYPAGTSLFCARFEPEDFDTDWGEGDFSEGATVAVRRGNGLPPSSWIMRHAHLTDNERGKLMFEKHASPDALAILYSLKGSVFDAFVEAWSKDGGMSPGKSRKSSRRSGNTRRR